MSQHIGLTMANLLKTSRTEAEAVAVRHELQRLANHQATYVYQVRQAVARVLAEERVGPCAQPQAIDFFQSASRPRWHSSPSFHR